MDKGKSKQLKYMYGSQGFFGEFGHYTTQVKSKDNACR